MTRLLSRIYSMILLQCLQYCFLWINIQKILFVSHFVVKPWIEYVNHSDRVQKGLCLSLMIHTVEGLKNDRFCSLSIVFERNHSRVNGYHLDVLFIVAYDSNSNKRVSDLSSMLRIMIQSLYHRWNSLLLCWKKKLLFISFLCCFPKNDSDWVLQVLYSSSKLGKVMLLLWDISGCLYIYWTKIVLLFLDENNYKRKQTP